MMTSFRFAVAVTIFIGLFPALLFSQKKERTLWKAKPVIETYYWEGSCTASMIRKMTLKIYEDSTYCLIPVECKSLYNTRKEWRAHKNWVATGTWNIVKGVRIYYQQQQETKLKQVNDYVLYGNEAILKQL